MAKTNPAFMSGVPELLVLRLLSTREMYGYELVKAIKLTTKDSIRLAEGVVYPTLHSLEARGMLRAKEISDSGRTRVYYRTTAKGKKQLQLLRNEWDRVSGGVNAALGIGELYAIS